MVEWPSSPGVHRASVGALERRWQHEDAKSFLPISRSILLAKQQPESMRKQLKEFETPE